MSGRPHWAPFPTTFSADGCTPPDGPILFGSRKCYDMRAPSHANDGFAIRVTTSVTVSSG